MTVEKKRALACNYCRRLKRKCSGSEPCFQCTKHFIKCEYSVDNRSARRPTKPEQRKRSYDYALQLSAVDNPVPVPAAVSANDTNDINDDVDDNEQPKHKIQKKVSTPPSSNISDSDAAKILNDLTENTPEDAHLPRKHERRATRLLQRPCRNFIIVEGADSSIKLSRQNCELYLQRHRNQLQMTADTFIGPDFDVIFDSMFLQNHTSLKASSWFLIYCVLGIGSATYPVTDRSELPKETQVLYEAATRLVGNALIVGNFHTAIGLGAFAHFSMMCGEFHAHAKFVKTSLITLTSMGYHMADTYQTLGDPLQREFRLRVFWHVYSVSYFHSIFISNPKDIPGFKNITAGRPSVVYQNDQEAHYLNLKIDLLEMYQNVLDTEPLIRGNEFRTEQLLNETLYKAQNLTDLSLKKLTNSSHYAQKPYCIVFMSLLTHVIVTTYRLLNIRSPRALGSFEVAAKPYIDIMYQYAIAESKLYLSVGYYVSHHMFMTTIMLLFCLKKRSENGQNAFTTTNSLELYRAIEVLKYLRTIIPLVQPWIEVLDNLQHCEHLKVGSGTNTPSSETSRSPRLSSLLNPKSQDTDTATNDSSNSHGKVVGDGYSISEYLHDSMLDLVKAHSHDISAFEWMLS